MTAISRHFDEIVTIGSNAVQEIYTNMFIENLFEFQRANFPSYPHILPQFLLLISVSYRPIFPIFWVKIVNAVILQMAKFRTCSCDLCKNQKNYYGMKTK